MLPCGSSATAKVIKCPYHGWTYGLDGALKGAPHFGGQPDFDAGDYPLIEARTHEWGGWVFVNVSVTLPTSTTTPVHSGGRSLHTVPSNS